MKRLFCTCFILTLLLGCSQREPSPQNDQGNGESALDANLHTIKISGVALQVEIVQETEELAHGLMFREDLADNQGMLFVFPNTRILSFWMRNTFIPLDIAFITEEGVVVDVQRMQPLDESKQYISKAPALYALEVNAGWFERNNLGVGSQVVF